MSKHLRAEHGEEPAAVTCPKPNDRSILGFNLKKLSVLVSTRTFVSPSLFVRKTAISRPLRSIAMSSASIIVLNRTRMFADPSFANEIPHRTAHVGWMLGAGFRNPGRVNAAVTMKRSARWSWCKRWSKTRSETATLTFGSPSAMTLCGDITFKRCDSVMPNLNTKTTTPNNR